MEKYQTFLIQSMSTSLGEDIDLAFLKECAFTETIDLSGPRISLAFNDPDAAIRDITGIRENDMLKCFFADIYSKDGINESVDFVVMKSDTVSGVLKISGFQSDIEILKRPSKKPILLNKPTPSEVISRLLPGIPVESSSFGSREPYHLIPPMRPTLLLRQVAAENGALCFYLRGKMVFRQLSELNAQTAYEYHHNDPRKELAILHYTHPKVETMVKDKSMRNYAGFHITNGWVESSPNYPVKFTGISDDVTLSNLRAVPVPVIDFICEGNGFLMPGVPINITWNIDNSDAPIDESLPERIIISSVTHWYSNQKYFSRVKGIMAE